MMDPDSKYNVMDKALQQLLREKIALDEDNCKHINKNLNQVLSELIKLMKTNDPVFRLLFKKLHYVGSYYENLRVKEPNEFDINLELLLPAEEYKLEINSSKQPGFAYINVKSFDSELLKKLDHPNGAKLMSRWLDSHGYLIRDIVLKWLQSAVDKAINVLQVPDCQVSRKQSGPAITLAVSFSAKKPVHYSVDLVPVFAFGQSMWPKLPIRQPKAQGDKTWFLVPKASRNKEDGRLWRMSFSLQEREIIHGKNNMKPIIKLIKLLRDMHGWTSLSSYYIKTIFLWALHEPTQPDWWQKGISQIFIHMLRTLKRYLMDRNGIPFYWDPRCELTSRMTPNEKLNISNRLSRIIDQIDQNYSNNPDYVVKFFSRL